MIIVGEICSSFHPEIDHTLRDRMTEHNNTSGSVLKPPPFTLCTGPYGSVLEWVGQATTRGHRVSREPLTSTYYEKSMFFSTSRGSTSCLPCLFPFPIQKLTLVVPTQSFESCHSPTTLHYNIHFKLCLDYF